MLLIIANFKKFCRFILVGFKILIRFRKLEHGVENPPRLGEISLRQKALADETKRVYARVIRARLAAAKSLGQSERTLYRELKFARAEINFCDPHLRRDVKFAVCFDAKGAKIFSSTRVAASPDFRSKARCFQTS